jgi:cytochrome P450
MVMVLPERLDDEFDYASAPCDDPGFHDRLHALRATAPAAWVRSLGEPAMMFTSYELVDAAFRDEATFPAAAFYDGFVNEVMGRNIECMYGDEHRRNRALASPAFRARLMPDLIQPLLEPVAHELIDRFQSQGTADLVADFTAIYPFRIILGILGLPQTSESDVRRWALGMIGGGDPDSAESPPSHGRLNEHKYALRCSKEFEAYVNPILERRRHEPGDDLISKLATEEIDGERLTDDEIFAFLKLLFPAGADTTYLGLGNILYALLTHRDQLNTVLDNPREEARWAVEEGLRWNPPVALQPRRNGPDDVVWHDVAIPASTPLIFAIAAANRDPAVFEDPDRFNVARHPAGTLTFGFGTHYCLGVHLAKAELDVSLRVLLERLPNLRLLDDGDVRISGTSIPVLRGPNRLPIRFD